jgi:hypothetical protein
MKGVKKWGWGKKGMIEIPFLIDNRNNIVEYQFPHYVVKYSNGISTPPPLRLHTTQTHFLNSMN